MCQISLYGHLVGIITERYEGVMYSYPQKGSERLVQHIFSREDFSDNNYLYLLNFKRFNRNYKVEYYIIQRKSTPLHNESSLIPQYILCNMVIDESRKTLICLSDSAQCSQRNFVARQRQWNDDNRVVMRLKRSATLKQGGC